MALQLDKMKGMGSWYFRGYRVENQLDERGATKQRLIYEGEYYSVASDQTELRTYRIKCLVLCTVYVLLYAASLVVPGVGAQSWPGYIGILALVPLYFLGAGLIHLWRCPRRMTYRDRFASLSYLQGSAGALAGLQTMAVLAEVVLLVVWKVPFSVLEFVCLVGHLLCGAIAAALFLVIQRNPARICA